MKKTEYWKMQDSIFIKVSEDGVFKDTRSVPLTDFKADDPLLTHFNGTDYYCVTDGTVEDAYADTEDVKEVEPVQSNETFVSTGKVGKATPNNSITIESKDGASKIKISEDEISITANTVKIGNPVAPIIESPSIAIDSSKSTSTENTSEPSKENYDFVQAPSHYNGHKIITKGEQEFEYETIEFIEAWLRRHSWMPEEAKYSAGNGLKYYDRVGNKPEGGKTREEKAAEDFEKISWYCLRAAKALRGNLYKKDK